ncbi:hypothetical protein Tco_1044319 [Tanacetum coccineum]|uniref:Uncharacterized protein n=1 Tax=Tanacetum coccineum TaxID=301880 RepID=A0ABQ5GQM1_9ASTR
MAEEDCSARVAIVSKFDMPHHQSAMSPKDVKLLARKYDILLYLHPCAPSEGWTMDKLRYEGGKKHWDKIFNKTFSEMKGWKDRFLFIDRRAIPDAMAWRHHDSDVNDVLPDNDFSILDVRALAKNAINLRPMHPELLFVVDLATVWDFPRYHPIFKDTRGNVVIMSEYLRFPFLAGISIEKGVVLKDPKMIAAREKKKVQAARATAKKKENLKRTDDEGGSSRPKLKKRKTQAKKANTTGSDHVSSPIPIRTIVPTRLVAPARSGSGRHNDEAQTTLEDEPLSPHQSANDSVYNFINIVDDKDNHSAALSFPAAGVFLSETNVDASSQRLDRPNLSQGLYTGGPQLQVGMLKRELMVHLAPSDTQEESNALTNAVALQRAWLADAHTECSDIVWKLVIVKVLEDERNNLFVINKDQALRIQELEAKVARKDSALAATERIHEYKESLSEPFNMAIQARWGKGLAEGRTKKEILAGLHKAENFNAYSDKKIIPYVHPDPAPSGRNSAPTISKALGGSSLPPNQKKT